MSLIRNIVTWSDHVSPVSAPGVGISVSLKYHQVWLTSNEESFASDLPALLCWELSSVFPKLKLCRKKRMQINRLMWTKTNVKMKETLFEDKGSNSWVFICRLAWSQQQPNNSIQYQMKLKWKHAAAGECWVSSCWHYQWRCLLWSRQRGENGLDQGMMSGQNWRTYIKELPPPRRCCQSVNTVQFILLILSSLRGFIMIY